MPFIFPAYSAETTHKFVFFSSRFPLASFCPQKSDRANETSTFSTIWPVRLSSPSLVPSQIFAFFKLLIQNLGVRECVQTRFWDPWCLFKCTLLHPNVFVMVNGKFVFFSFSFAARFYFVRNILTISPSEKASLLFCGVKTVEAGMTVRSPDLSGRCVSAPHLLPPA